jgi:hypothetical protein
MTNIGSRDFLASHWRPALLILFPACYAAICIATQPAAPISMPDSAGYIGFASIHALGYPIFVKMLGVKEAIVAQPVVFAAALAYLGIETLALTNSIRPAAAVVAGCMLTPQSTNYHAAILTESLFMSGVVAFLAAIARLVREPSTRTALPAAIIAGVTATIRRTGYVLVVPLVVVALVNRKRLRTTRSAAMAWAVAAMLGIVAFERVAAHIAFAGELPNLLGRHLFAKAAIIDALPSATAPLDARRRQLEQRLEATFVPIRRLLNEAPPDIRAVLTLYYEACLQGRCVPEFASVRPGNEDPALARDAVAVALERMARAPANVAALALSNYRSLWAAYRLQDPDTSSSLNAFFASHRPLPFETEAFALRRGDTVRFQADERVRFIQPGVLIIGWATGCLAIAALAMAVARFEPPPALQIACLAALTAHAALGMSALVGRGIARYTLGVWPAIVIAMVYAASWFFSAPRLLLVTRSASLPVDGDAS